MNIKHATPKTNSHPDTRANQLSEWVASELGRQSVNLSPLGGDAGFRRYFRFETPSHWLAVDAPPATEDSHQFVRLAQHLRQSGLLTPEIKSVNYELGWLLVEDFGDNLLNKHASKNDANKDSFYTTSFESLIKLQQCDLKTLVPSYDAELLARELHLFDEWFVGKMLGYALNDGEKLILERAYDQLIHLALEQPQTLVHRDFHSRNLIEIDNSKLGILDFQGAVWGPCTYDLVSLLRDCYLRWPAEQVKNWALEYQHFATKAQLLDPKLSSTTYLLWFDAVGLQRHLKVLGIFARLHLRDNKPQYLADLPLVLRYVLEVCAIYPQFSDIYKLFIDKLIPLAKQQTWYKPVETAGDRL